MRSFGHLERDVMRVTRRVPEFVTRHYIAALLPTGRDIACTTLITVVDRLRDKGLRGASLTTCTSGPERAPAGASWTGGTPATRIRRLLAMNGARPRTVLRGALASAALLLPVAPSIAAVGPAIAVSNTETAPVSHHGEAESSVDFDHHS